MSREALLEQMNAELEFAFEEVGPGAGDWHTPGEVEARARRNPTMNVEPRRLASELLAGRGRGERIPAPLHGQLRKIGALFGARHLLLPLALDWEPGAAGSIEAAGDSVRPDSARGPGRREGRTRRRAALDLALVDIRRGVIMWRGTVHGAPAPPDSPGLLATLAARLAEGAVP